MAILLKVNWVDQAAGLEPHERIREIGGETRLLQWHHTEAQAIEAIERGQFIYYMENGNRVLDLKVNRTEGGEKYLVVQDEVGKPQILLNVLAKIPSLAPRSSQSRLAR